MTRGHDMEQRFAVFAEGPRPKIYKFPINLTARLINEIPGRDVEVFETLNDAREAALAIIKHTQENTKPNGVLFSARANPEDEDLLNSLSELTEDRVERYPF